MTFDRPILHAVLYDKDNKRVVQTIEADTPEHLQDKVDAHIHDLFVSFILLSAIVGIGNLFAATLIVYYGMWWFVLLFITLFGTFTVAIPMGKQWLKWRESWKKESYESFEK